MEVCGQLEDSRALTTGKVRTKFIGDGVRPRAALNALKKREDYFRCRESNHDYAVVQTVA